METAYICVADHLKRNGSRTSNFWIVYENGDRIYTHQVTGPDARLEPDDIKMISCMKNGLHPMPAGFDHDFNKTEFVYEKADFLRSFVGNEIVLFRDPVQSEAEEFRNIMQTHYETYY